MTLPWPPPTDHVPGDLFPDLLRDWTGPVLFFDVWTGCPDGEWKTTAYGAGGMANGGRLDRTRLPLTRPEAAHRLCCVLAAGEQWPVPTGSEAMLLREVARLGASPASTTVAAQLFAPPCPACGYVRHACRCPGQAGAWRRPPAPAWHCLPVALGGSLPDAMAQHNPALLACSAWRVKAGLGPVRGVLGAWADTTDDADAYYGWGYSKDERLLVAGPEHVTCYHFHRHREGRSYQRWAMQGWGLGWAVSARGPETGDAGRACADAAALAAGFALVSDDGSIALPWPKERPC